MAREIVYYNRCVCHNFYNRCVCQSESIVQCSTVDSLQSCSLELMWVEVHCRETFLPLAPPPIIRFWQSKADLPLSTYCISTPPYIWWSSQRCVLVSPLYNIQYTIYMTSARMRWTVRTAGCAQYIFVFASIRICIVFVSSKLKKDRKKCGCAADSCRELLSSTKSWLHPEGCLVSNNSQCHLIFIIIQSLVTSQYKILHIFFIWIVCQLVTLSHILHAIVLLASC